MIFLVQFGALRARAILLVFEKLYPCLFIPNCTRNHLVTFTNAQNCTSPQGECNWWSLKKFTRAYLFQIALEITWLPILMHKIAQARRASAIGGL